MNPITPTHTITGADGVVYPLRFQHRDFTTAEYLLKRQGWKISLLGPAAKSFWGEMADEVEIEDGVTAPSFDQFKVSVLLFAGLVHRDKALTLEQAQSLVDFRNAGDVTAVVMAAVAEALAPMVERATPEAEEKRPLAIVSGGANAGASDATTSDSPTPSSGD